MKGELAYNRKLFSHSIKQIQPPLPHSNPQTPSRSPTSSRKEKQLMKGVKRKNRVELVKSEEQHKSYQKMVDQIMKKHVEQHNLPLLKTKLFIKHNYKNYRITNSEKRSPKESEEKGLEKIAEDDRSVQVVASSLRKKKQRSSMRLRSQIFQSLIEAEQKTPKATKPKRMPLQLPLILKYDRESCIASCKIANSSLFSQSNNSSNFEDGFQEMKKKFIKKYVKSYTEN